MYSQHANMGADVQGKNFGLSNSTPNLGRIDLAPNQSEEGMRRGEEMVEASETSEGDNLVDPFGEGGDTGVDACKQVIGLDSNP